jgi:AraC family transcriptional regulator
MSVWPVPDIQVAAGPGQRQVLAKGSWPAAGFFSAIQDISRGTIWSLHREIDTIVVHLGGPIKHLETELDGCGAIFDPPMPGEVWIIPSGSRYSTEARGGIVRYAELHVDRVALNRIAGTPLIHQPVRSCAGVFDGFLHRAALRLEEVSKAQDDLSKMAAETLSLALMTDFYSRYLHQGSASSNRKVLFDRAGRKLIESFIHENLGTTLKLDVLAEQVRMTVHEFLIAFRAAFGTTPAQYVIEQRLRWARWLLLRSSKDVAEVAIETGFSSHAHLSTTFRNRLKMTPHEFRSSQRRTRGAG